MFPSLVNCCTIDWFTEWPEDALEKVATKFLEDMDMDDEVRMLNLSNDMKLFIISSDFTIFRFVVIALRCADIFMRA